MNKKSKNIFKNKIIFISGGTGSFGKAFTRKLLKDCSPEAIRIYSRDELKQYEMKQEFENDSRLRFFIGDVRDKDRLTRGMLGADYVIHAAALKQVPSCEYNPVEAIKTNVNGAINVIDAALEADVPKVIALSTDKASQPINLYGATKLCSDKLFIQANNYRGLKRTSFAVVRYGNVIASRGSVIPTFESQSKSGLLTVTHKDMTRFWITLDEAVDFVFSSFPIMQGGELFIPKIPSMRVVDLAKIINPDAKIKYIGIRPGEKIHESLISVDEAVNTFDIGDRYLVQPTNLATWELSFKKYGKKKAVKPDFSYTSLNNPQYLSTNEMKAKLKKIKS